MFMVVKFLTVFRSTTQVFVLKSVTQSYVCVQVSYTCIREVEEGQEIKLRVIALTLSLIHI